MSEFNTGLAETDAQERERLEKAKAEAIRKIQSIGSGSIKLSSPIMVQDEPIYTLNFDFNKITGLEYVSIMRRTRTEQSGISDDQAFELFALAVRKKMQQIDMEDIREQLGLQEVVTVIDLAKVFFRGLRTAGTWNISKPAQE